MKANKLILIITLLFVFACKEKAVPKPDHFIEKQKMIEIMYDMAVLEAIKSQNPNNIPYPTPVELLKNKYNIDSLTFANNDKYYASDIKEYQKMNQSVLDRIQEEIQQKSTPTKK